MPKTSQALLKMLHLLIKMNIGKTFCTVKSKVSLVQESPESKFNSHPWKGTKAIFNLIATLTPTNKIAFLLQNSRSKNKKKNADPMLWIKKYFIALHLFVKAEERSTKIKHKRFTSKHNQNKNPLWTLSPTKRLKIHKELSPLTKKKRCITEIL